MFKTKYTPIERGFDEHMGYFQGCESAYTHVAACCGAGSPTNDQVILLAIFPLFLFSFLSLARFFGFFAAVAPF